MKEKDFLSFPYVTRKMLAFEEGASFDLEVITASKLVIVVEVTGMTREGPFKYELITDGLVSPQTTVFRIPDLPIWLTVKTAGVEASVNDVYAMIYARASQTRIQLLCQGNVGQFHGINFPNQVVASPLQQRGASGSLAGADPAAGAEFSITVPAGEYWLLKQLVCTLVTDATVDTRRVALVIRDPVGNVAKIAQYTSQVASKTGHYHWFVGSAAYGDTTTFVYNMPLPRDLILAPGYILLSSTELFKAGDDWGIPRAYFERFYSA